MNNAFLDQVDAPKAKWRDPEAEKKGIHPAYRWTGLGRDGLEVVYGNAGARPSTTVIREVWKQRHGHRAAPLLVVVAYPEEQPNQAMVCGPAGDNPTVVDLDLGHVERLARAALGEPHRHLAIRFLAEALEGGADEHPGLRNKGLLATHELLYGVPRRTDWEDATARSTPLLRERGQDLVEKLGYVIEARARHSVLRSTDGRAQAVAVFLHDTEQADQPAARFENQTPVTYALSHADRDNLPWVVAVRGGTIRLYSTSTSGAAGQRGWAETFVELNLPLLLSEQAGYLQLLFSSSALAEGGTISEIRRASSDYASELSARLRERVYKEVVPRLAVAVAGQLGGTNEDNLENHYRTALTILFRLMFVAYAEDSRLLPLHVNGEYTDHALKTIARRLSHEINTGQDLGFDNPLTEAMEEGIDANTDLWDSCKALFHAVDGGHVRWGVPAYDGGLFSTDERVNPVGGTIEDLTLTNAELGPALTALIVDRSPDGDIGPIDFRSLSVREFGTIYEGLLESDLSVAEQPLTVDSDGVYLPARDGDDVVVGEGGVYLHNQSGVRKSTGSYFTKPFAVNHLIAHSVDRTLDDHLDRVRGLLEAGRHADAAEMLFDFRIADIAMGSGHFLTAVVDRLEARYTTFLADNLIPEVNNELDLLRNTANEALGQLADTVEIENSSLLRRLIARRCVYGVDLNPLAVELARVGMWIHTFVPGLPLSFLDHNLRVGNSLTGIGTIEEAIDELANSGKYKIPSLFDDPLREALQEAEEPLRRLARITDATAADVKLAHEAAIEADEAVAPVAGLFDRIVAARIGEAELPTILSADQLFELDADYTLEAGHTRDIAEEIQALHFPVAFPEVFLRERPGFDVLVGNPPWDTLKAEPHKFWSLRFPGLRSMPTGEMNRQIEMLQSSRPDIAAEYSDYRIAMDAQREGLLRGPYPGLGSGDPDLSEFFAWRFWQLLRRKGRMAIVLPRSILMSAGTDEWRADLFQNGKVEEILTLVNNRKWIFSDVHPQYTIALISAQATGTPFENVLLRGPYHSKSDYDEGKELEGATLPVSDLLKWTPGAALPLLPSEDSTSVYRKMRAHPAWTSEEQPWRVRTYNELHATADKVARGGIIQLDVTDTTGMWPVYKGESFGYWRPETGIVYGWADPGQAVEYLQKKRARQVRNPRSAFYGMGSEWASDPSTLPCMSPRLAWRMVARATDTRSFYACLLPAYTLSAHHNYLLFFPEPDHEREEAYILGCMCSMPFDWHARLWVEANFTGHIVEPFPIPAVERHNVLRRRVEEIAGTLASVDERYESWANAVGVSNNNRKSEVAEEALFAELDAVVALLYGLERSDVELLFKTFHRGWNYRPRLTSVLDFHRQLAPLVAEVGA